MSFYFVYHLKSTTYRKLFIRPTINDLQLGNMFA